MFKVNTIKRVLALLASVATLVALSSCNGDSTPTQVSEQPDQLSQAVSSQTTARTGRLGIRSRIAYSDIQSLIETSLPNAYPVQDSKRVCKKIFGLKACGTARWNLTVERKGDIAVTGKNQHILVKAPIAFDGVVGIDGGVAKALGLSDFDVGGTVLADIKLGLDIDSNWCPAISVSVDYNWIDTPTAVWRGSVDLSLESVVNDALDKQLSTLEPRINELINCEDFREQLQAQWRSYSFAFDLPVHELPNESSKMHLNFTPSAFSFSGLHTDDKKLGLGFAIDGVTVFEPQAVALKTIPLPPLEKIAYQNSRSEFDILFRATYTQLEQIIQPSVQGKTFTADSLAGTASVTVSSIALSGSMHGVTVSIEFNADLPGSRKSTPGTLFLNARPVVNSELEQISITDLQMTQIIDSTLWDLIGGIFENQIISAIEKNAVLNYSDKLRKLEEKMRLQLKDENRTAGLIVNPTNLSISVLDIFPEKGALAALARVSAELDIDVPLKLIKTPIQ